MKRTKCFILSAGLATGLATMFCACSHRGSTAEPTVAKDSVVTPVSKDTLMTAVEEDTITIETISFEKSDYTAEVSIIVDWPVAGGEAIVDSLRRHIAYLLEDKIDGPEDIKAHGEAMFESYSEDWHGLFDDTEPDDRGGSFDKTDIITKLVETDRYVTYYYHTYTFAGGAHGYTTEVGFTFRKSDGKQVQPLADSDSPQLAQLIKEGVRAFFSGGAEQPYTDEELLEFLFTDDVSALDNLPLPNNPPYLTETGLVFLYTQYEIGPYSSGIITFEIPFKEILPFLSSEGKELIQVQRCNI